MGEILDEKDAEIHKLVRERGDAVNRLLGDREETIAKLQQELREMKAENRELRSVNLESTNTLHELRMANNELMTSQMHMSATINVLEDTIGELKVRYDELWQTLLKSLSWLTKMLTDNCYVTMWMGVTVLAAIMSFPLLNKLFCHWELFIRCSVHFENIDQHQ